MLKPIRSMTEQELWLHAVWHDSLTRDCAGWDGAKCFACLATVARKRQGVPLVLARLDADGEGRTGLCPTCGLDTLVETDRDRKGLRLARRHWLGPDGLQDWPAALARSKEAWRAALAHQQRYLARCVATGDRLYRRHRVRWAIGGRPPFLGACGPIPPGWEPVVARLFVELAETGWNREVVRCRVLDEGFDLQLVETSSPARRAIGRAHERLRRRCQACGRKGRERSRDEAYEENRRDGKIRDALGGAQLLCDACWLAEPLWPAEEIRWLSEAAREWSYMWGALDIGDHGPWKRRHLLYAVRLATSMKHEVERFISRLLRGTETHAIAIEPPSVIRGSFRAAEPEEQARCLARLKRLLQNDKLVVELAHGVRRLAR